MVVGYFNILCKEIFLAGYRQFPSVKMILGVACVCILVLLASSSAFSSGFVLIKFNTASKSDHSTIKKACGVVERYSKRDSIARFEFHDAYRSVRSCRKGKYNTYCPTFFLNKESRSCKAVLYTRGNATYADEFDDGIKKSKLLSNPTNAYDNPILIDAELGLYAITETPRFIEITQHK